MTTPIEPDFQVLLKTLCDRGRLSSVQVEGFISTLIEGNYDESLAAAVLTAWQLRGASGHEIASAVTTMRKFQRSLATDGGPVLDTCGTGGDGSGTFNISTAVSLVVAACGVKVVKHGNRAVSSRSGSADVLQELGVPISSGPEWAEACLAKHGYAFCFAPHFHPAMAKVAPLRKKLGVRTIFNVLGPLLNPAQAAYHLLGVGLLELLDPLAEALWHLGCERAILVHGEPFLDEVSLLGPTQVRIVEKKRIKETVWRVADFGLEPQVNIDDLFVADAKESAAVIGRILAGEPGPAERIVAANAAAALLTVDAVKSLPEGVAVAREAIRSGRALGVLRQLQSAAPA